MSRNARVALICLAFAFGMVGAAYAAVPLYRIFCQVTGFDGTVRRAEAAPTKAIDRTITVRFDTNVRGVPFDFDPQVRTQDIQIGKPALAFFKVTNRSDRAVVAQAAYNVVPETAGPYFQKLECFCFTEQTLQPGQTIEFPMTYFVDPEMASDPETRTMNEIVLSYTFFPVEKPQGARKPPAAKEARVLAPAGLGGTPANGL